MTMVQQTLDLARCHPQRSRIPRKHLESLTGKLQYVTPLIKGSRPFTRGLYQCLYSVKAEESKPRIVTLSERAIHDLQFWSRCLPIWNGVSLINPPLSDTRIYTDASPWGFGMVFGTELVSEALDTKRQYTHKHS